MEGGEAGGRAAREGARRLALQLLYLLCCHCRATLPLEAQSSKWAYLSVIWIRHSFVFKTPLFRWKGPRWVEEEVQGGSSCCPQSFWLGLSATLKRMKLRQMLTLSVYMGCFCFSSSPSLIFSYIYILYISLYIFLISPLFFFFCFQWGSIRIESIVF